jgi:hypothetical protein
MLAAGAIAVWALPPLALTDPALIRLGASQLVLVAGAVVVIMIERQIEQSAQYRNLGPAFADDRDESTEYRVTPATR